MSGIKTGNKGFVNPADGKVYTIDPNGVADEVSKTYDPGDMTVDQTVKDVNKKTKITLGTYLSQATKGLVGSATKPNAYPIDASTEASLETSLRTDGYPSPLIPASSGNSQKFDSGLHSSLSKDFSDHQGDATTTKIKKGLSSENGQNGHVLLKSVTVVVDPTSPVQQYQGKAILPNYRSADGAFTDEDVLSPSKKFDYTLVDYTKLQKVKPADEAVSSGDLTLNLKDVFNFASKLTNPGAGFLSLTTAVKNVYPVSSVDVDAFAPGSLVSLTTDGIPSPLTAGTNKNAFVFNDNLPSSYSAEFDSISGQFKKGKQNTTGPDGHTLLSTSIITNQEGFTKLNLSLRLYFEKVAAVNFFYPDISNSVLSKDANHKSFLIKEIDASSPPSSFEPIINIGTTSGKYSGQESIKTQWSLIDQRKKASEITQANQYSVDPPPGGPFDILIPTNDPATSLPLPLAQSNKDSYINRQDIKPLSRDPSIQNFSKGKESSDAINGNELLKDVKGSAGAPSDPGIKEDNPLYNYVGGRGGTVLNIGNNRWTNSARPGAGFNPTMKLSDGTVVSHLKLAQVGTGLLQRAAAEIPAWISSQDNKFNPNGTLADAGAIIPSVAQLGILKVNNALLEAKDVLNSISGVSTTGNIENEDEAIAEESLTSIAPFDGQSWGTLTSPSEPFEDPSSIGLTITMFLLVIAISLLFGLFETANNTSSPIPPGGQLALGKFKFYGSTGIGAFGLRPTNNRFLTCLGVGAKAFFIGASNARISDAQVVAAAAGIGLDSLIGEGSAVGANLIVARTIIRSGLVIAQYVERIIKAASQNPLAGIQAAAGMTKILRSSKLVAALNVFAQLGDTLLDREYVDVKGPDGNALPGTGIDSQSPLIFHSTVRKNRLSYYDNVGEPGEEESVLNYNSELAWASKRAPSLYLIPPRVAAFQKLTNVLPDSNLGAFAGASALTQPNLNDKFASTKTYNTITEKRISTELRQKLEEVLDAEYVPFYFHDIRTNEIISFHAFLTSLSDDYSSTYESVDGFGRVEPVKIYKGTQRKIGISFAVAATSQDDFHDMWFKINKLVTLVYPQYTSGRDLVGTNYQFKAPFSQMIGASPLIRIRLGDLFRSNYSRFGLSRLFGAADGNMQVLDKDNKQVDVVFNENQQKKSSKIGLKTQFEIGRPGIDDYADQFVGSFVRVKHPPDEIRQPKESIVEAKITGTDKGTGPKDAKYEVEVKYKEQAIAEDPPAPGGSGKDKISTAKVLMPRQHLELTEQSLNELSGEDEVDEEDSLEALELFMDPVRNTIVKSFESAGGKGLAGVIESMNFDWYNQTTWEIAPGYTAPKMCKVTIAFSPIHDITPGIDHMGYNRAPIYPVGNAMNGRK